MTAWRPKPKAEREPLRLSDDPEWYENPVKLRGYRESGLALHDIQGVRTHVSDIEMCTHAPKERVKIGGLWCPVRTMDNAVYVDGKWTDLLDKADQTTKTTRKHTRKGEA